MMQDLTTGTYFIINNTFMECSVVLGIQCPDPDQMKDGVQSPSHGPYYWDESITFTCNEGLTMFGISYLTCQEDTYWDFPVPSCSGKWTKLYFHMCIWSHPRESPGECDFLYIN